LAAGLCHWAIANALSRPFSLNGRGLLLKGRKGRKGGERGRKGREGNPPPPPQVKVGRIDTGVMDLE